MSANERLKYVKEQRVLLQLLERQQTFSQQNAGLEANVELADAYLSIQDFYTMPVSQQG